MLYVRSLAWVGLFAGILLPVTGLADVSSGDRDALAARILSSRRLSEIEKNQLLNMISEELPAAPQFADGEDAAMPIRTSGTNSFFSFFQSGVATPVPPAEQGCGKAPKTLRPEMMPPAEIMSDPRRCDPGNPAVINWLNQLNGHTDLPLVFDDATMQDPNDWKVKYFDLVVVINKAVYGQRMRIYKRLNPTDPLLTEIVTDWKVSTGREHAELSTEHRLAMNCPLVCNHSPTSSYVSHTPTGYYTPIWLDIAHVSNEWEDSAMDHAVFFSSGIATHRAPRGAEGLLGHRASGACVRMTNAQSGKLFWLVRATGGPVSDAERQQKDWRCDPTPEENGAIRNAQAKIRASRVPQERAAWEDKLQELQDAAAERQQKCQAFEADREASGQKPNFAREEQALIAKEGFKTFDQKPMIPVFDQAGTVAMDPATNAPQMRPGFRTLYVVEDHYLPPPPPPAPKQPKKQPAKR